MLRSLGNPRKNGHLYRKRHHCSRGAGAGSQASGHVHRRGRRRRLASSGVGDARQLHRRGDERLRLEHRRHAARGRLLGDDCRRRPRHPGRQASEDEEERARSHLHDAACRRQVRARQLQDLRRPARRRRERGQCAVEGAGRHGAPRRRAVGDEVQAGAGRGLARQDRRGSRVRHDGLLPPRLHHLPESRVRRRADSAAAGGLELPAQGRQDRVRRRGAERARGLSAQRGARRLSQEDPGRAGGDAGARAAVHHHQGRRRQRAAPGSRDAVDPVDRRARAQLRQRHSHRLGRHPRERVSRRARQGGAKLHRHPQPLPERGHADRRGHPRRAGRGPERLRAGAAVPGADQGSPQQPRSALRGRLAGAPGARALAQHQHQHRRVDRRAHHPRGARPRGEPRRARRKWCARARPRAG